MSNRSLKIVRKRKQEKDDLSFMPPYSEQAKYIELANISLSSDGAELTQEKKVIGIGEGRREASPKLPQQSIARKLG